MPELKPINGHTPSRRPLRTYLEGQNGERALAKDFFRIEEFDRERGLAWSDLMDEKRARCLRRNRNGQRQTSFIHYVVSPDPRDKVQLPELRQLIDEWVREYLDDCQVAVVYHSDNAHNILHAHIVVNNVDLAKGGSFTNRLTPRFRARMNNGLQNMALERGWRAFSADHESLTGDEMSARGKNVSQRGGDPRWRDHAAMRSPADKSRGGFGSVAAMPKPQAPAKGPERRRDKAQHGAGGMEEREGYVSWKQEIQDRVDVARAISRSEREFRRALETMGITLSVNRAGDYLYGHPMGGAKRVTGRRLGLAYERRSVQRGFELNYVDFVQRRSQAPAARARAAARGPRLTEAQRRRLCESIHATVPGSHSSSVRSSDVARLLAYNKAHGVTSLAGYGAHPRGEAARMRNLALGLGIFDEKAVAAETKRRREDARLVAEWLQEDRAAAGAGGGALGDPAAAAREMDRMRREEPRPGEARGRGGEAI